MIDSYPTCDLKRGDSYTHEELIKILSDYDLILRNSIKLEIDHLIGKSVLTDWIKKSISETRPHWNKDQDLTEYIEILNRREKRKNRRNN